MAAYERHPVFNTKNNKKLYSAIACAKDAVSTDIKMSWFRFVYNFTGFLHIICWLGLLMKVLTNGEAGQQQKK